jgi:hypothetical protein
MCDTLASLDDAALGKVGKGAEQALHRRRCDLGV